jgi:hypothetical protein
MSQVEDYGHRIPQDSAEKKQERHPDPIGKYRKSQEDGSSNPAGNFLDFFRWIPVNFL